MAAAVVAFNWLLLGLAIVVVALATTTQGIQVLPQNATAEANSSASAAADHELSASERNRRLVPYMAFYFPAADFPINQQYVVQRPKSPSPSPPDIAAVPAPQPSPPPGSIALPPAYVRVKIPSPAAASAGEPHYQPTAGGVYHTVATYNTGQHQHHQQHPHQHQLAHNDVPLHHQQPATASLPPAMGPLKHKTVQHFPPTKTPPSSHAHQPLYQRHQHQHQSEVAASPSPPPPPLYQHQRTKVASLQLTPFTSFNTLPGHFVPVIYAPVVSRDHEPQDDGGTAKSLHYSANENPELLAIKTHEQTKQQQQKYFSGGHATQPDIVVATTAPGGYGGQQQQALPASYAYRVIDEAKNAKINIAPSAAPPQQTQNHIPHYHHHHHHQQHQQQQTYRQHSQTAVPPPYGTRHTNFQPPQPESFFDNERPEKTPQEKYVTYLQQRIRYNKTEQQQLQQQEKFYLQQQKQQRQRDYYEHQQQQQQHRQEQHQRQQQHDDIYVIGTIATSPRPIELHGGHSAASAQPAAHNYPQHSPVGHAVYARPELPVPSNHQAPTPKPRQQQIINVPLHTIVNELNSVLQPQAPSTALSPNNKFLHEKYVNFGSTTPHYIDYIIEEPKQSLDEEQHRYRQQPPAPTQRPSGFNKPQQAGIAPTAQSPSAGPYVVISTSEPQLAGHKDGTREHYDEYKTRLQPIAQPNLVTRRPTLQPPSAVTPKYIYYTQPPSSASTTSPAPAVYSTKLKPAFRYELKSTPALPQPYAPLKYGPSTAPTTNAVSEEKHNEQSLLSDPNQLPDIRTSSLADILHKLQASNHLPQTLTADNIDNSIKTLITILNNLKHTQAIVPNPPQHHEPPPPAAVDYDYAGGNSDEEHPATQDFSLIAPTTANKHPGPSTGRPGVDYPNYAHIPPTKFDCNEQRYKGFFGDPETNCQVWHYCDLNGGKASFLCPNGTIFSQIALTCDWWFNVKCSTTSQLYVLNERLYKYILPFTPKFPEDYSGPLVDKYLAMKFEEMEEKMRSEKKPKTTPQPMQDETASKVTAPNVVKVLATEMTMLHNATANLTKHETINSKVNEQSSERNLLIDDEVADISQRSNYAATTQQATTTAADNETPLSLKPIVVVSSTVGPDSTENYATQPNADSEQPARQVERETQLLASSEKAQLHTAPLLARMPDGGTTKISIEKMEVIEIKSDGTSGHLLRIFENEKHK